MKSNLVKIFSERSESPSTDNRLNKSNGKVIFIDPMTLLFLIFFSGCVGGCVAAIILRFYRGI